MRHRLFSFLVAISFAATCFAQRPRSDVTGDYLLKTAWGGSSPFNALSPDGSALGCRADAFAQVLYFHRLAPHGQVSYKCKNGVVISEDFSQYKPQWERFALTKKSTDARAIRETSRFIYYVAVVVRKDFGTDQYVDYPDDAHKSAIESHFDCTLTSYANEVTSNLEAALRGGADMCALLKVEIDAGRPAGFYYTYGKADGHAVVIDGYTSQGDKTYFHVNFGWFGSSDGWYSLAEDLPKSTKKIMLITIVPGAATRQSKPKSEKS
jgi:Peptidase C10 family